jgi:hypothetical protein
MAVPRVWFGSFLECPGDSLESTLRSSFATAQPLAGATATTSVPLPSRQLHITVLGTIGDGTACIRVARREVDEEFGVRRMAYGKVRMSWSPTAI